MAHRMYVAFVSLSSASLALLAASTTLHAVGCGISVEDLFNTPGRCVASPDDTSPKCICSTAADCPESTECVEWVCDESNHCGHIFPTDTPVINQVQGDCKRVECAAGERQIVSDDSDAPANSNACMSVTCIMGEPHEVPTAAGIDCNEGQNRICNGMGDCVFCVENTALGCNSNEICHKSASGELKCVHHCFDNAKNAGETDIDCGGSCAPCGQGSGCLASADCKNNICSPDNVCCDLLCDSPCWSCANSAGKCEEVPTGTTDAACPMDKVCAKTMGCVLKAEFVCSAPQDCMSGSCIPDGNYSICDKGTFGRPCVTNNDCQNKKCENGVCH